MLRFIATAIAVAIVAIIAVASSGLPTSAQSDPVVSVDAVSDAGNTATAVGTIDTCLSATTGYANASCRRWPRRLPGHR